MDDIMYLLREKCHRKTAFCYIIMTIPVTLNLVNSESICLVRPKIPRRDEKTSKNLGRLFSRCRATDGRLPTLHKRNQRWQSIQTIRAEGSARIGPTKLKGLLDSARCFKVQARFGSMLDVLNRAP